MPTPATIERFIARVESNAHVQAIEEFYAAHASMRENTAPPRVGKATLIETERQALAGIASVQSECVRPYFLSGDMAVIRWIFRIVRTDGTRATIDELAYQRWEGEKIVEEQFFYDPSQLTTEPPDSRPLAQQSPVIAPAVGERDYVQFRALYARYVDWMRTTYADMLPLVESYYGEQQRALAHLPGHYANPEGCLLLARQGEHVVGSVALRKFDQKVCEMKSMFVDATMHGTGLGRQLARAVIAQARALGYTGMVLETGIRQVSAQRLYETLGFVDVDPYYDVMPEQRGVARFMRKDLTQPD